jgi:hypothetical protein
LLVVFVVAAPDLGGASSFEDVKDLLIHVLLGINGARARHLEHMDSLQSAAAVELDKSPMNAHAFPPPERQFANIIESDGAAVNREILLRHVCLIGRCLSDPAFGADKVLFHFNRLLFQNRSSLFFAHKMRRDT